MADRPTHCACGKKLEVKKSGAIRRYCDKCNAERDRVSALANYKNNREKYREYFKSYNKTYRSNRPTWTQADKAITSREYDENAEKLEAAVGKPEHAQYLRREHELEKRSREIRRFLKI